MEPTNVLPRRRFLALGALALISPRLPAQSPATRVVILGGGTSHDFARNYQGIDAQTLAAAGASVRYTDQWSELVEDLASADVLIQASNQAPPAPEVRAAIAGFAHKGGGIIVVHAGAWYNWPSWPDYNRLFVGGGTHSHDRLGSFTVTVTQPEHPIMKGVPATFPAYDELYHQELDADAAVEVLATATSPLTGKTFPSVWIVEGKDGRIVCIALGHDEQMHNNPAYRTLLTNAVQWAARR